MRFNFKYITIVIVMLSIVQLCGQSYFSTLLPINKYSMNARELAMGGSWYSHGKNPAFGIFDKFEHISSVDGCLEYLFSNAVIKSFTVLTRCL